MRNDTPAAGPRQVGARELEVRLTPERYQEFEVRLEFDGPDAACEWALSVAPQPPRQEPDPVFAAAKAEHDAWLREKATRSAALERHAGRSARFERYREAWLRHGDLTAAGPRARSPRRHLPRSRRSRLHAPESATTMLVVAAPRVPAPMMTTPTQH